MAKLQTGIAVVSEADSVPAHWHSKIPYKPPILTSLHSHALMWINPWFSEPEAKSLISPKRTELIWLGTGATSYFKNYGEAIFD